MTVEWCILCRGGRRHGSEFLCALGLMLTDKSQGPSFNRRTVSLSSYFWCHPLRVSTTPHHSTEAAIVRIFTGIYFNADNGRISVLFKDVGRSTATCYCADGNKDRDYFVCKSNYTTDHSKAMQRSSRLPWGAILCSKSTRCHWIRPLENKL